MWGFFGAVIIIGVPTVLFLALRASYKNYKKTGKVETGVHYDFKNKKWAPGDPANCRLTFET